jgi:hypothetical protein
MIYATYLLMILVLRAPLKETPAPEPKPAAACDPALTALFTPSAPLAGRYIVCTTVEPIEHAMAAAGAHYGSIESLGPLDAFGAAGSYDRTALARLYGGTRAKVVRGWREDGDHFVSTTLVSPYPDPTLTQLMPGTLEIRWTMERHEDAETRR